MFQKFKYLQKLFTKVIYKGYLQRLFTKVIKNNINTFCYLYYYY